MILSLRASELKPARSPTLLRKTMNVSGRGILMMKSFMDLVVFERQASGLVVQMTKRFAAASG